MLSIFLSKSVHGKSRAPSALLQTFLLFTGIVDTTSVILQWIDTYHGSLLVASILTAYLAVKAVLFIAKSTMKSSFLTIPATRKSREDLSGIFGKNLRLWINPPSLVRLEEGSGDGRS